MKLVEPLLDELAEKAIQKWSVDFPQDWTGSSSEEYRDIKADLVDSLREAKTLFPAGFEQLQVVELAGIMGSVYNAGDSLKDAVRQHCQRLSNLKAIQPAEAPDPFAL